MKRIMAAGFRSVMMVSLLVAALSAGASAGPKDSYRRTSEYYRVPNVTLLNQDGKKIALRTLLDSGKPVIIDFIYTTCTTICPILSAGFANLQQKLGADSQGVQLISISIDPEHDRPEKMKRYLDQFRAREGWEFLTGSREDITLVLRAFDAFTLDKMAHQSLYLLRGPNAEEWVRLNGMIRGAELMNEFRRIEKR